MSDEFFPSVFKAMQDLTFHQYSQEHVTIVRGDPPIPLRREASTFLMYLIGLMI
jgi:hypothetical protein